MTAQRSVPRIMQIFAQHLIAMTDDCFVVRSTAVVVAIGRFLLLGACLAAGRLVGWEVSWPPGLDDDGL